jgi:hypothetical protein
MPSDTVSRRGMIDVAECYGEAVHFQWHPLNGIFSGAEFGQSGGLYP